MVRHANIAAFGRDLVAAAPGEMPVDEVGCGVEAIGNRYGHGPFTPCLLGCDVEPLLEVREPILL
jgi:hypothetical protein